MARKLFDFKIDVSQLEDLSGKLGDVDSKQFGESLVDTLNEVAQDSYDLSRKSILSGINLSKSYVEEKFELRPATASKPSATVVADGTLTNLSHYGAMRFTQDVKHLDRAKGDPGRGYVKGQKADTMTAQVTRGSDQSIGKKFVIAAIRDNSGNPIVFRGTGRPGKPKNPKDKGRRKTPRQGVEPVLGPSVYQLFAYALGQLNDDIAENLEEKIIAKAEQELQKALK